MSGWDTIGGMLAGGLGKDAYRQGQMQGAKQETAIWKARHARNAELARQELTRRAYKNDNPNLGDMFSAGIDPRQFGGYQIQQSELGARMEALEAARAGDDTMMNRLIAAGIDGQPLEVTTIQDHTIVNPYAAASEQGFAPTAMGQAKIGTEQAHQGAYRAQAGASGALGRQRNARAEAYDTENAMANAAGFQGKGSANMFGDSSLSGTEYVATIPVDERSVVQGILNGTKELPRGSALKSPYWQSVMASVMHADPSWNEASYKQYARARKEFTTGKRGTMINNINTAMQHANELLESIKDLDNPAARPLAALQNVDQYFGDQDIPNFNAILTPLASELASVYKNGNAPTDQETQQWREMISPNMSKAQQMNVLRRWIDLLAGKMNETRRQYQASMSDMAQPLTVVSDNARQAMERITEMADKLSEDENPHPQAISATPIYAPGGDVPRQGVPQSQAPSEMTDAELLEALGG